MKQFGSPKIQEEPRQTNFIRNGELECAGQICASAATTLL